MIDELELYEESALNLPLKGSVGSFKVGTGLEGQNSLEVKYFLTHVGLDFSVGNDEALLSQLAPVREIFNFESLDFDEIMQRDIDDARVSSELIPYLLDETSQDLVKLFPPIVVVVLPVKESENKPADKYPEVRITKTLGKDGKPGIYKICSGLIGQEVFEFEQPILNGKKLKHDKVRLRLNTSKSKLVIVDGQHRAMALLALYRNIKDAWSDEKRAPFKEYYSEWTSAYIQQFNLKEINLPIILCTIPSLDENYSGNYDLKKAARSIFLTLNKTARKVSNSRNILLDDRDIIAYFLRGCLSKVKKIDARSPHALRMFNVELDQAGDKLKIQTPIAISAVNHIYYIIEHLMLNNGDVKGASPRAGKFYKRTDLNTYACMERLNGRNLLGAKIADSTTRDNFSLESANKLLESFMPKYGDTIIKTFQMFRPYEVHNKSCLNLETRLEAHQDRTLKPILFEGQGMGRVFETHRKNLKEKLKDGGFHTDVPKIEAIATRLDATAQRLDECISELQLERARLYIDKITDKSKFKHEGQLPQKLVLWINDLYDNILTSVAFQAALICGFYSQIEKTNTKLLNNGKAALDSENIFNEYILQISNFFTPESSSQFRKLISIFSGEIVDDLYDFKIAKTQKTFRNVVYRGEMQPEQWPKYKYLILEVWKPTDENLVCSIDEEIHLCRKQVFSSLYNVFKTNFCQNNSKLEENLEISEITRIFNDTYDTYNALIKNLGSSKLDKIMMKEAASIIPVTDEGRIEEDEFWKSVNGENAIS